MDLSEKFCAMIQTKIEARETRLRQKDQASAQFFWGSKFKELNAVLEEMDTSEKLVFLQWFFELRRDETGFNLLRDKLNKDEIELLQKPLLVTLSPRENQLRFWFDNWASVSLEQVDSCGRGLLLDIRGERGDIRQFVDALVIPFVQFGIKSLPSNMWSEKDWVFAKLFCLERDWEPIKRE